MTSREPVKAIIQNLDTGEKIPVLYNPVDYTRLRSLVVNRSSAGVQFQSLAEPEFSVDLFFDTYEQGADVRRLTGRIAALQEPTEGRGAKREPPKCLFSWGGFQYSGILSRLTQRFTMFLASGVPVRAELSLTFTATPTAKQVMEDAGLDNCRKLHIVKSSDRLDVLAFLETGDPANWRAIARANGIEDPIAFPTAQDVGRTLVIPDFHA
ncbi:peptidoglycan-binding protein LysM [Azospirillum cavernae]|uniref:Peptidoglycan-binding protein LysM n=1 Tax=Azospirillum cavernae TaxID=2320860 RepID=A0A418VPK2_9PROT|nr:peptidoglycan-binding protein LysM [Azospirillum cavernae]RJF78190.1 peptidoglycan-binding protein LysM [Azospirillum cavernae]